MRRISTSYGTRTPSATTASKATFALSSGLLSGLLLTGCGGGHDAAPDPYRVGALPAADLIAKAKVPGHWVKDGDDGLRFTGQVGPGSAAELTAALTKSPGITSVTATVPGGDLAEGVTIGQALHDHKLTLNIEGPCVGPCADYWFPAAAKRTAASGSWLGYVPDLSESATSTATARAAESKLYTASGVDGAKFHTALDAELRETPGDQSPPPVAYWMPDKADLIALGYPDAALAGVWLPPNLVSANAHAHAWGDVVAYKNTLVGLPLPTAAPSGAAGATPGTSATPAPAGKAGQAPVKAGAPLAPAAPVPAAPALPGAPAPAGN